MKKILLIMILLSSYVLAFEHIGTNNIDSKIQDKNVILDFYASWCPPCKIIEKHLNKYNDTKSDDVIIYKINIDENRDLLGRFGIKSIPTLVYVKNGKPVLKEVGLKNFDEIKANVNQYIY